jgi:hypothetical protein
MTLHTIEEDAIFDTAISILYFKSRMSLQIIIIIINIIIIIIFYLDIY